MAVRFALDDPRPGDDPQARRTRKPGNHARTAGDQACLDALAAMLRGDPVAAKRHLGKIDRQVLRARLLPAVLALADAADALAAGDTRAHRDT